MGDQKMPHDGLKGLGVRRDGFWVDSRHDADGVADLSGIAAIAADDAENRCADLLWHIAVLGPDLG